MPRLTSTEAEASMQARTSLQLGNELQRISDSLTWQLYRKQHPQTKIGFTHRDDKLYFTLSDRALGHRGVIRYADTAQELIEIAHDALFREGLVEVI
jgi:hypothetical protein